MDGQDWNQVTFSRGADKAAKALRESKHPQLSQGAALLRKIENEDIPKIKSISGASRHQIVQGRVAQKWNQTQLNVIRDIESGKSQPTPQQLQTINRALNISLKYD
jgi:ribosome-binding protein aMBF1 (putative translation factor)